MKIPKPLIVSLVLLGCSQLVQLGYPWTHSFASDPAQQALFMGGLQTASSILYLLAPAIWVYFEAKKENTNPLFWILLCCATGILGLVLFYAYFNFKQTKERKITEQSGGE